MMARVFRAAIFAACLLSAGSAFAAGGSCGSIPVPSGVTSCFYISAAGADTNSGTSESSPWLHAPGMANCSNTCRSTTPAGGEGFIFRGGDTWHFGKMCIRDRNIRDQFDQGASLWLIKSGDKLAGYGWTMLGRTIAPYYFLLGENDVQLFDFYVFPKFRGRAMHWLLTVYILQMLAAEGAARAFADTGEWNQAQLSSFAMTPFRRLGLVRSFAILGHTFVSWVENEPAVQLQKGTEQKDRASSMARSHE